MGPNVLLSGILGMKKMTPGGRWLKERYENTQEPARCHRCDRAVAASFAQNY
jgi:ribosomal protein L34E